MTAPSSIDPAEFLHEHLTQASADLMRQMLTTFINTLLSADAGAWVARGGGRSATPASPNATGTATATWTPGPGPWTSPIPKLRSGTYFPEWLLERCRRVGVILVPGCDKNPSVVSGGRRFQGPGGRAGSAGRDAKVSWGRPWRGVV